MLHDAESAAAARTSMGLMVHGAPASTKEESTSQAADAASNNYRAKSDWLSERNAVQTASRTDSVQAEELAARMAAIERAIHGRIAGLQLYFRIL